jgi:cytochrome P450
MTQAFRKLAQYPEYAEEVRVEVEGIHRQDGWSKSGVDKMQRVDSFLKETMRLETSTNNASYPCCMFNFI